MMFDYGELYQQLILEHNKSPRNFGTLPDPTLTKAGHNPGCGDLVNVYLLLEDDIIRDIKFEATGCAISIASASIMTTLLLGKSREEANALFTQFHHIATEDTDAAPELDALDPLAIFAGVHQFPSRVKCATLAWHTVHAALHGTGHPVVTE